MNERFDTKAHTAHELNWERLVWWVNGTLSDEQGAAVEAHIAECELCARESRALQNLQWQLRSDPVLLAPQGGWQRMSQRLDSEDELLGNKGKTREATRWRWVAAAQAATVVAMAIALIWQANQHAPAAISDDSAAYVTLTSAPAHGARGSLRMVFRRDVSLSEVGALLQETSAQIVAGPTEAGVFTVSLQATQTAETLTQTLSRLRADARVLFVEPIDAAPAGR